MKRNLEIHTNNDFSYNVWNNIKKISQVEWLNLYNIIWSSYIFRINEYNNRNSSRYDNTRKEIQKPKLLKM